MSFTGQDYAVIILVSASMAIRGYPRGLRYAFWSIISFVFINLGFNSLDRPGSLSESVSPVVMFLFKHALSISMIYSYDYRSLKVCVRQRGRDSPEGLDDSYSTISGVVILVNVYCRLFGSFYYQTIDDGFMLHTILPIIFPMVLLMLYASPESTPNSLCQAVHFAMKHILLVYGQSSRFQPVLWILVSAQFFYPWRAEQPVPEEESANTTTMTSGPRNTKWWKFIEFVIATLGTALFQYFFRLKSFDHVVTFLYLAVVWLGNLALLRPSTDFGVLNFLLGNVIVGSTVNRFGLGGKTWIAYGACVFLYLVRLLIDERIIRFPGIVSHTFPPLALDGFPEIDMRRRIRSSAGGLGTLSSMPV